MQRLELAFPATLYGSPAWDPKTQQLFLTTSQGYAGVSSGLDALALTAKCRLRRRLDEGARRSAQRHPDRRERHRRRRHRHRASARLRRRTGKLIANRELRGAAFAAPIAIGRDVAVVTWTRKLMVYRLPPPKK